MHDLAKVTQAVREEPGLEHSVPREARPSQPHVGDSLLGRRQGMRRSSGDRGRAEGHGDRLYRQGP